jgi:hypothetical protein
MELLLQETSTLSQAGNRTITGLSSASSARSFFGVCAPWGTRTPDPLIKSQLSEPYSIRFSEEVGKNWGRIYRKTP